MGHRKGTKPMCKGCGACLRICHFILNGMVWVIAIIAIFLGAMVALSTNTIVLPPFEILDFLATTPIILIFQYGLLLGLVTSVGCFVGTGANLIVILIYILLVLAFALMDFLLGIDLLADSLFGFLKENEHLLENELGIPLHFLPNITTNMFDRFLTALNDSMNGYNDSGAPGFGIFRLSPKTYWDHIQIRGKCCGIDVWTEWLETPFANETYSFPYGCCNDEYRFAECGEKKLGPYSHPYSEHHSISDMVFPVGCIAKLPYYLRENFTLLHIHLLGLFIAAVLIFAVLIAILLCLIRACCYDPDAPRWKKIRRREMERARRDGGDSGYWDGGGKRPRLSQPHENGGDIGEVDRGDGGGKKGRYS